MTDLGIEGLRQIEVIGRGGFGVVHRAEDHAHGRNVAVKILPTALDERARNRFDRERRAMGSLSSHPSIGTVHTSGVNTAGQPYIVMELLEGGSLGERIANGPLPVSTVVGIGIAMADALDAAHQAGVLHLDVKPENVLLSSFGEPKLVDFGIAALTGDEYATSSIHASPAYAAPEVLSGIPATMSADIYGLAATMYAILMGEAPYGRHTSGALALIGSIALDPVPRAHRADIPIALADLLEQTMAKTPEVRPATMAEFATRLRAIDANPGPLPTGPAMPPSAPTTAHPVAHPSPPAGASPLAPPSPPAGATPLASTSPPAAQGGGGSSKNVLYALVSIVALAVIAVGAFSLLSGGDDPDTGDDGPTEGDDGTTELETPGTDGTTDDGTSDQSSDSTSDDGTDDGTTEAGVVPDATGLSAADAEALLIDAGLTVNVPPHCNDTVTGQVPEAATEATPGAEVTLRFERCRVPDLVGSTVAEAETAVAELGDDLTVVVVTEGCADRIEAHFPAAGLVIAPEGQIELELQTEC